MADIMSPPFALISEPGTGSHRPDHMTMNPRSRQFVASLGLLIATAIGGCHSPSSTAGDGTSKAPIADGDRPGGPPPKAYETFDMVWSLVETRHFDPDHNGVDWDAVRETYRPRVADVRTDAELRRILTEMVGELGQTHFVIIPSEATFDEDVDEDVDDALAGSESPGTTGIRLGWAGDDVVVTRVAPGSEADAAGVRPGWLVDRIGEIDPADRLAAFRQAALESETPFAQLESIERLNLAATRPVGDSERFLFRDGDGRDVERTLAFGERPGTSATFGVIDSPVLVETDLLSHEELRSFGIAWSGDDAPRIARIRFNIWLFPILVPIAETVDRYRDVDGFIIDLRGNPGGIGALAMGVAGHFLATEESLGDMQMRDTTMHFQVNPQRATPDGRLVDPFAGPVAIVVDRCSASTSEVFAAGLQQLGRVTVIGRPTAGAALPAQFTELPNGDSFMFAVADFIGPAGTSIEGTGVIPDIEVPIDRQRLLSEGDPDIATATRWIVSELDSPTS